MPVTGSLTSLFQVFPYLTRGQVPENARNELLDLIVPGLLQEPDKVRETTSIFNGTFVLIVLTSV